VLPDLWQLFLGNINGYYEKLGQVISIGGGSLGETSALLLTLGGLYLLFKKIANWKVVVSYFGAFLLCQTIFHHTIPNKAADPLFGLLSGGVLFAGYFMITDPISMARTEPGRWIYGILAGALTQIIRTFSLFAEGAMFAILLANMFAPIIDYAIKNIQTPQKTA
jgi:Na+-transporting NADH:ubiquinone oxidoreductase subunit B